MTAAPSTAKARATVKSPAQSPSPSLILKLKVPLDALQKFLPTGEQITSVSTSENAKSSSSSTPLPANPSIVSNDTASETNSTPAPPTTPGATALTGADGGASRKGIPGPKPGAKRSSTAAEGTPKPRGKPGPKKKPRLDDGTIDHGEAGPPVKNPVTATAALNGPKLGPKANQGAINAGLRALDKSGNPCRRWEKKRFMLKSFTGVVWEIPTWKTPKPVDSSTSAEGSPSIAINGDSDSKENKDGSELSGVDAEIPPSSPIPAVSTPAS